MKILHKILLSALFVIAIETSAQTLKDCAACSTQIIKNEQIKNISLDEIRLLTNEIFARNGHHFDNGRFQNFFEEKSWYTSKNNNQAIVFNEIEKQNIKFFQDRTKEIKAKREDLITQLYIFKNLILTNKKEELRSEFGFFYEPQTGNDEAESLKKVLNKIDLDDVNYYKNKGLNNTTTDNGFVKIIYELTIEDEKVNLYYNYASNSEIMEDFGVFTDYHSEDEFLYNWQFEFKKGKLKFIR